jgi:hypothetical protein
LTPHFFCTASSLDPHFFSTASSRGGTRRDKLAGKRHFFARRIRVALIL